MIPKIDTEFKSLIPSLTTEEYEQLEQNILENRKCYDAIILWNSIIVDGHNRYEICIKHGIEFMIKDLHLPSREAAKIWILENQLGRRNLTDAMRIEIALLKADILRKKAQKNLSDAGKIGKVGKEPLTKMNKPEIEQIHARKIMAADAGVGEMTFHRYTQVKDQASPQLLNCVQSGDIKIGTAHRLLPNEILKQLGQIDKKYKFMANAIPQQGLQAANPGLHHDLSQLAETLRELINKLEKGGIYDATNNQDTV